jgi:hypothetical protein
MSGGPAALQKMGWKRERWGTQPSRTPGKVIARDTEQHSIPSGSSIVTLEKFELLQYSPTSI